MPKLSLGEIYSFLAEIFPEAELIGNKTLVIEHISPIEKAQAGSISFIANSKYEKFLAQTKASALIVSKKLTHNKLRQNSHCLK